jgi:hypothetical protein
VIHQQGATIARMAKFKPIRPKKKDGPAVKNGLPCVILLIGAFLLVMLFIYFVMKNANG